MTHKERILAVIEHKPVDKIPTDYWGTLEATEKFIRELNLSSEVDLWKKFDIDKIISVSPKYIGPPLENMSDYWGIRYKPIIYGNGLGTYDEISYYPLQGFNTIEEIDENYTWPKVDWFDFSCIEEQCEKYPEYAVEGGYMAPFYMYANIRGLEQTLIDLAINEELAHYIIGRITQFLYEYHERFFDSGKGKIDIAQVTDDFGTQQGLIMSIDMFDKFFKEPYRRLIKLVKDYGIKVFHHDDGSIMPLIPRLVELGIDILNPIQWHLPGMDIKELKVKFGDYISFHGGIDNQYVLPFGKPEEVKKEVLYCLDILASDGTGYILAPCHNIQVNTPTENFVAMYDTANEYRNI